MVSRHSINILDLATAAIGHQSFLSKTLDRTSRMAQLAGTPYVFVLSFMLEEFY